MTCPDCNESDVETILNCKKCSDPICENCVDRGFCTHCNYSEELAEDRADGGATVYMVMEKDENQIRICPSYDLDAIFYDESDAIAYVAERFRTTTHEIRVFEGAPRDVHSSLPLSGLWDNAREYSRASCKQAGSDAQEGNPIRCSVCDVRPATHATRCVTCTSRGWMTSGDRKDAMRVSPPSWSSEDPRHVLMDRKVVSHHIVIEDLGSPPKAWLAKVWSVNPLDKEVLSLIIFEGDDWPENWRWITRSIQPGK